MSSELDDWFTCDGCAQDYLTKGLTKVVDHVHKSLWIFCADCADDYYVKWIDDPDWEVTKNIAG